MMESDMLADYRSLASTRLPAANQEHSGQNMIGVSPAFKRLERLIDLVAPTYSPVLICGPSGSGKEIVAQLLHHRGPDRNAPFVDLNCGAIPEHLVEAELFGHVKGAFTGAATSRPGHFAITEGGTLFLDEIGELPLALQPKLLRVLETRTFRPIGSIESCRFDGRIVAATHCDLQAMVRAGTFREDLYYRLAVLLLEVPGLDQRREDIPGLVMHFAVRQARRLSFTGGAIDLLTQHGWTGHVRELRNFVERLSVLSDSTQIDVATVAAFLPQPQAAAPQLDWLAHALLKLEGQDKLAAAESLLIDFALAATDGNKTAAARTLGISRKTIERRLHSRQQRRDASSDCLEQGQQLVDGARFHEAIPVLKLGLRRLGEDATPSETRQLRFDLLRLLAVSHRAVSGWRSVEANSCYSAALVNARKLGNDVELTSLLFGIWTTQLMALELNEARASAQEMLERAQASGNPDALAHAHLALANTLFWLGDNREALACLGRGRLLDSSGWSAACSQGIDIGGLAVMIEALCKYQLGQFAAARKAWDVLVKRGAGPSDGCDNPFHRAIALQGAAWLACLFEDTARLSTLAPALETLCVEHSFAFYRGIGMVFRGCHLLSTQRYGEAEQVMAEGYEQYMLCEGGLLFHSFHAWKRGEALLLAGRAADSARLIAAALEVALDRQERVYLSELLDVRARAWLALGDVAGAERELRNAMSTAVALGSASGGIDVATHLAQLLADTGRHADAIDVLTRALRGIERETIFPRLSRATHLLQELVLEQANYHATPE